MVTVREWAECLKSDMCDYIRITDSETGDLYFAWDYSDAETEFRDIMEALLQRIVDPARL